MRFMHFSVFEISCGIPVTEKIIARKKVLKIIGKSYIQT
jgi:hypothetical protein